MSLPILKSFRQITLSIGAVALLAGAGLAQGPVGEWNMSMNLGNRQIEAKLNITENKDGLAGTWTSEQRGETPLKNVKFADGKLTFDRMVSFGGQDMEMSFEGTIADNTLTGQLLTDFGEMELEGTRAVVAAEAAAEAKPAASPLVGTWEVTSSSERGDNQSKMVINADLSGTTESEMGEWPITNVKLDGKKVSFSLVIARQEREFSLDFAGTIDGKKLTGAYSVADFGEIADVTAVKLEAKPAEKPAEKPAATAAAAPQAAMVGTWDLTSTSQRGERKSKLTINDDFTGTYETERGSMPVSDLVVKDGDVSFAVTFESQRGEFVLNFKGKLENGEFKGAMIVNDREMAQVTGKKGS